MIWRAFKQSGLIKQTNIVLLSLCAISCLLFLWCLYKLLIAGPPGPLLPAEDSLLPLVVNIETVNELPGIIAMRPLFWRARAPVENKKGSPVAEPTARDFDKVRVVGVYSAGVIILGVKNKGRVARGEELLGWTLDRVDSEFAFFLKNGAEERLPLQGPALSFMAKAKR